MSEPENGIGEIVGRSEPIENFSPPKKRMRRIKDPSVQAAFREVYTRKQNSKMIGFTEIAKKYGVSGKALAQRWSEWTKGLLDPGIDLDSKESARAAKWSHERQLHLLRRMQVILLGSVAEGVTQVERSNLSGKRLQERLTKMGLLETLRALKFTQEFIAQTEKGYLVALDEYAAAMRAREEKLHGKEVVATREEMTDEQRALRALDAPLEVVEQVPASDSAASNEPPKINVPDDDSPITEGDGWNSLP